MEKKVVKSEDDWKKELTPEQAFPIVETWRQAARAAALGEHDFDAGLGYGRLSDAQCMTVLKDAAEVTRALVGLDRRLVLAMFGGQEAGANRLGGRTALLEHEHLHSARPERRGSFWVGRSVCAGRDVPESPLQGFGAGER